MNIFSSFSIRSISSIFSFDANFRDISIPRPSHHSHNFILPVIINPQIIVHISQKFYLNCSHSSSSPFATKINFCTADTKFQTSKSFKYCTKTQTIKKPTLFSVTPISFNFTRPCEVNPVIINFVFGKVDLQHIKRHILYFTDTLYCLWMGPSDSWDIFSCSAWHCK